MRTEGNIKTKNGEISMNKLLYMLSQTYSLIRTKYRRTFGCGVYLILDQYHVNPFQLYIRWEIELIFSNYKNRGFE